MPSSNLEVAPTVLHFVYEVRPPGRPLRILDVGPGWGKYAVLLREFVDPDAQIAGVEAWEPYIERHRLAALYDPIIADDVRNLTAEDLAGYDVVLMADVIEHMPKPDGWEVINRVAGYVVISTPRDYFSNGPGLPHTEDHVSHWTLADFETHPRFQVYSLPMLRDKGGVIVRLGPKA